MVKFTFKGSLIFGTTDKWEMRYFIFTSSTMEFSKREQHVSEEFHVMQKNVTTFRFSFTRNSC